MRKTLTAVSSIFVVLMSGCATFDHADQLNKSTLDAINHAAPPTAPAFEAVQQPYLLGAPVKVDAPPPVELQRDITLVIADPMPLRAIAARITGETGIPIDVELSGSVGIGGSTGASAIPPPPANFGSGSIPPPPAALFNAVATSNATGPSDAEGLAVKFHGTRSALFDYLAAKAGLAWKFAAGRVVFYDLETRTFEIPALAWKYSGKSNIVASAGAGGSSSGGGGGGGGAGGASSGTSGGSESSATGSTEIDNTSEADLWKNIQSEAQVASGGARVFADSSAGTVTVTGTPAQISKAEAWAKQLTASLSKQVAIEVHVYTIKLNDEQNYGFTPTLAFKSRAGTGSLALSGPSVPLIQGSASPLTFGGTILSGPFGGTSAAVQALATLGTVTQNYEQTAVTLNGQPVPIQVGQQTGYLASVSNTSTANVGSTTALTPGFVTTGFTGLFMPRVAGSKILLGMNLTISTLLALQTESSGGQSIQVPTTGNSSFQQSVALESGSTLLLTGFKNNNATTTRNGVFSPFFPLLGGGADATTARQLIAIVINARML